MKSSFHTRLYDIPFLRAINFTPVEMEIFEQNLQIKNFRKGELILSAGEEENEFRFVHKGLVRKYFVHEGREINTRFITEGGIVCVFSSYSSHTASPYFIEAMENTVLLCFKREDMDHILIQGPKYIQFGISLMNHLILQKEQRERDLLSHDALGRLQHFLDTQPGLFLKLPQTYIASYLNIRPETLSALKRKLINKPAKD
jgi:CRP-like cAMP-binding protein